MSGPARAKRLAREYKECQKDATVEIEQVGDQVDHFIGSFPGPTGTPYEGGWFRVDVTAPERYPFEPLKMKFITKVYHPNVSSASGYICLDILKNSWTPVFTMRTCLVSLQSLLSTPEPNDPQDAQVAQHYLSDRKGFEETAKFWTEVYASRPSSTTNPILPPTTTTSNGTANPKPSTRSLSSSSFTTTSNGEPSASSSTVPKRPRIEAPPSDDSIEVIEPSTSSSAALDEGIKREARLSGLDWQDVETFSQMGFDREVVVETLRRLNWRRGNKGKCSEEEVVEKLIAG